MDGTRFSYIQSLLTTLLSTPSPTGDTEEIIEYLASEIRAIGLPVRRNHKGGLLFTLPGADSTKGRLLTAHVDTLGAIVKEIKSTGRLGLFQVGGYFWNTIEGEYCTVRMQNGTSISGTVILHNTSAHVNRDVGKTERTAANMEVVLDADVSTAEQVRNLGIEVGDFVSFDPRVTWTENGYVKSRHLDDKASVAILIGLTKAVLEDKLVLPYPVTILISNFEEVGFGGNSNIPENTVEYLAVDMGAIGDGQTTDEHSVSICAMDASGPYHLRLRRHLVELARVHRLHYAVDIYPFYGSDASAAMRAGTDVVHGLIGPGVANSHAYERMHADAIRNTYGLLLAYVQSELA